MFGSRGGQPARAAGLVASTGVVAVLVLAFCAGHAAAAPACSGNSVTGQGSVLEAIAQQNVWGPNFGNNICNKGSLPKVAYNPTNSDSGMAEWNYDGKREELNLGLAFIGTSMAPTAAQIANIKGVAGGANVVVVPVAQTAIAIVAHPPAGCSVEEITNGDLNAVFEGRYLTWDQLDTDEGECNSAITRVVRRDAAGTTYNFKNYLFQVRGKPLCPPGEPTWQQLEPVAGGANTTWPDPETCPGEALSPLVKPAKGGDAEVVDEVDAVGGSIGYAALPQAMASKAGGTSILALQNNGLGPAAEATFASPASGSTANCAAMSYKTPANVNSGLDLDWSQVFGAKPAVGEGGYPLCALAYTLAFHGYGLAGFAHADEITVRDYLTEYVTQAAGQGDISTDYYLALPSTADVRTNILGAAQKAAVRISF